MSMISYFIKKNIVIVKGKQLILRHKKVVENYFFMTMLQVLNSFFYLLIYPFIIRVLGPDSYGLYVFAFSISTYFVTFVNFGFDLPAAKKIALNSDNQHVKSYTLSCVFTAKIYLEIFAAFVFIILLLFIPSLRVNWIVFVLCFIQTLSTILFPSWYFQGVQKMKIVTLIQIGTKLLSLPFILILIKNQEQTWLFALIVSLSSVLGAVLAAFIIKKYEKLNVRWVVFSELIAWYQDALPFFWTTFLAAVKQQSIAVIIGSFFSMSDVAIYDLGYKIFSIPNILFGSINSALFPKIAVDNKKSVIKKVFKYETFAGLLVILSVILFGRWIVLLMGGENMIDSYYIAIILSFGVLTFLLVSGYINFIFVPQNKYYLVTKNQIVAFLVFFFLTIVGLLIYKNIMVIAIAWSMAGLFEIIYCNYLINKHKLF